MAKYKFTVKEILAREVIIDAKSIDSGYELIEEQIANEEIVLDASDFTCRDIDFIEELPEFIPFKAMDMDLNQYTVDSCTAILAIDTIHKWMSIYSIRSLEQGKGHCQKLIRNLISYCKANNLKLFSSVPLNYRMKHILDKYNIEYAEDM